MSLVVNIRKRLDKFTLDVNFESGTEILGLLGASGCGKSMTLKCVAGIEKPDSGHIELDGVTLYDSEQKVNLPPQKRGVGYLFQNCALFPNMTVKQNIMCGLKNVSGKEKRSRLYNDTIELMRITDLQKRRPCELSGGEAQRTALARILVSEPKLLLLDEPFSALDAHLREKLQVEMKKLLEGLDKGVIIVTHDRSEAYRLCSKIAVMDEGNILALKDSDRLFADPGSLRAGELTGCKNNAAANKLHDYTIEVPDWGITLNSSEKVRNGLKAVGIRAHYFTADSGENLYPVTFVGTTREPFETIFEFRYAGQSEDTEPLWWRIPNGDVPKKMPEKLGISSEDVLLYY